MQDALKRLYFSIDSRIIKEKGCDRMVATTAQKQIEMHMDFFDKTTFAIANGYYLEAMFREYAAIEGRLEILLGVLGAPCNKHLPFNQRKDMKISHRITCLSKWYKNSSDIGKTKITPHFFESLKKWTENRNIYIHGLYKNEIQYRERCEQCKRMAEEGLLLTRMLYNEVRRVRRYLKNQPETELPANCMCCVKNCIARTK